MGISLSWFAVKRLKKGRGKERAKQYQFQPIENHISVNNISTFFLYSMASPFFLQ